jgi:hypothetical protein
MRDFPGRRATIAATALALGMAGAVPAIAAGWDVHELTTPLGDKGVALTVPAKRMPGVRLAIACDADTGARWRAVGVVEDPESKAGLGMNGDVRLRFGETSTREVWEAKTTPDEHRIFTAPDATRFARRLLRAEAASPAAEVTIEIHGVGGKPVPITFPLAGLHAEIGTIGKRCADWELEEKR